MDKDTLKGKAKDMAGRAERQVGEWTDDSKMESEGAARQAEGKAQKGIGKAKEMGRDAMNKAKSVRDDLKRDLQRREDEKRREEEQKHRKVA